MLNRATQVGLNLTGELKTLQAHQAKNKIIFLHYQM